MKIATWNVNGLRARQELIDIWLQDRQPDVVGLQELKAVNEIFPHEHFADLGYQAVVHGQKAWNGVAILAKSQPELLQEGLPGQDDFGARLITARVGEVVYCTVYCPNGKNMEHDDYPKKLAWFDSLIDHLGELVALKEPFIIGGDFNICATALDTHDEERLGGKVFHSDHERDRMRGLEALGLVDLYRDRYPDERKYSWWDYRGGSFYRNLGLRIDLLYGNEAAHALSREVTIDRDYRKKKEGLTASDHAPVFVELDG